MVLSPIWGWFYARDHFLLTSCNTLFPIKKVFFFHSKFFSNQNLFPTKNFFPIEKFFSSKHFFQSNILPAVFNTLGVQEEASTDIQFFCPANTESLIRNVSQKHAPRRQQRPHQLCSTHQKMWECHRVITEQKSSAKSEHFWSNLSEETFGQKVLIGKFLIGKKILLEKIIDWK